MRDDRRRILVVDDEESIRFTFSCFLEDEGYEVATAASFEEAKRALACGRFDLAVSDIILGGKTGVDLLREIRETGLDLPFVLVTGFPHMESATEAVRLGAFDYIPKPVKQDTLLRVVRVALAQRALAVEKELWRLRLEAVFHSVRDGIITVDDSLRLTSRNDAAATFCALADNAIGHYLEPRCDTCSLTLRTAMREQRQIERLRIPCSAGGRDQVVSLSAAPLMDGSGGYAGGVLVVRDETRLVSLERDLEARKNFHGMIGTCSRMQELYSLVEMLAEVDSTVLICGESGTGKELVAEALHFKGKRKDKPIVRVNCAALSDNLLESELFGHVRGAFTGALTNKIGRFQKADGGTIFLDEIGDISAAMQLRLLRVLQEKEIERVGDSTPVKVDVRVVAATHQNLAEKVKKGEFRADLYYRLNVVKVDIPPLRDRRPDIPLLVDFFLDRLGRKFHRTVSALDDAVMAAFMAHPWPGNIRQLEHVLEHAVVLCRGSVITQAHLPADFTEECPKQQMAAVDPTEEREAIFRALARTDWNKAKAARLLGMSRRTIYRKIEDYSLQP